MMTHRPRLFLLLGLLVAGAEEFITQGVLKGTLTGWIAPTLVAFVPFLLLMGLIGRGLARRFPPSRASLRYYLTAGGIGLLVEWFLIGLSPWKDPNLLQVPFQAGMFSFWGSVAFAPVLLLDRGASRALLRKRFRRFLLFGLGVIYFLTFAVSPANKFPAAIGAVILVFLLMNPFYCAYFRSLRAEELRSPPAGAGVAARLLGLALAALAWTGCVRTLGNDLAPRSLARDGKQPADLAILDAKVFTSDARRPWASAVAVKGGRIAYVGDDRGVADHVGPHTRVIHAHGGMLTPGFVDNHCHIFYMGALKAVMAMMYEAKSLADVKATVLEFARKHPEYPFVLGVGWRYGYLPGGRPTAALLDTFLADRPAILWSFDGSNGWVNSAALAHLRRTNPAAFRRLGAVTDEKTGQPTGCFLDFHGFVPYDFFPRETLPRVMEERMLAGIAAIVDEALAAGVTTFNDAQISASFLPLVLAFKERGGLARIRARALLYVGHHVLEDEAAFRRELDRWKALGARRSDDRFWIGDGVKLYIDGVYGSRTAAVSEPYEGGAGGLGRNIWSQESFDRVVELVDGAKLQACTHACGDRGIALVVNAYERARRTNGPRDARHRIEHCEMPLAPERARMARLGVLASMQACHFYGSDRDVHEALGELRMKRMMPWRSLERDGVDLSFGSDWLAGPINPLYGLFLTATRLDYRDKRDWAPEEAISIETAIRHYTIGSARALLREKEIGSIEVGKRADLVLFALDLRKITSLGFLLTRDLELGFLDGLVLLTLVDGRIVYSRPGLRY